MASLRAPSLLALSCLVRLLAASSATPNLKAQPGDDVTLSCQAPDGVDIAAAEWSRPDLKKEPVFLYRDGRIVPDRQPQSFKNRVELKDKEMKNGDLSVILKNVTKEDRGTYQCRFIADGAKRRKRAIIKADPISTIRLEVVDPVSDTSDRDKMSQDPVDDRDRDEPVGRSQFAAAVVPVLALLVVVLPVVAAMMYRKHKASREHRQENRDELLSRKQECVGSV